MSLSSRWLMTLTPAQLDALPREAGVVILPIGAVEQHGPHLPVGTDACIGAALLQALDAALPPEAPVWFAPPIWISKSNEHLDFPGVLTLSRDMLADLLAASLAQLREWGFPRIALLNTHGGNLPLLRCCLREWAVSQPPAPALLQAMPNLEGELPARELALGLHAGTYETALMLALAPEACDAPLADTQWIDHAFPAPGIAAEDAPATFAWTAKDLSPSGTMGDARAATAAQGQRWISLATQHLLDQIRNLT